MTTTLSVELVPLDDLRPDPANPRRISEDELDALERSLRQFGFVQPVLARREDQTVIGGHQRLVAARRLGLTSVPVAWLDISVEQELLCGDATKADDVTRLLDGAEPKLLTTDPPYGVSLDGSWRDGVYNALGPAEAPYMRVDGQPEPDDATRSPGGVRGRTPGHRNASMSGDTRADWSAAFALVPSLQVGYVWYASSHTLVSRFADRSGLAHRLGQD